MRAFVILCFVTWASARPQGYYYMPPHVINQLSFPSVTPTFGNTAFGIGLNANIPSGQRDSSNIVPTTPAIVSKHFYIHSAADDDDHEIDKTSAAEPIRKNYNIVFIKSPAQRNIGAAIAAAQQQNEEKTVIYVLNKKTDLSEITKAVDSTGQKPSKPEVFFIKYKTPEEAVHAQHEIQAKYNALGGTSEFTDEGIAPVQSFVGSVSTKTSEDSFQSDANRIYLPPVH